MAISLSGVAQYFSASGALSALNGKTGCTLMAWINAAIPASEAGIVALSVGLGTGSVNARARLNVEPSTGATRFQGRDGGDSGTLVTETGSGIITPSVWTHIAATLDLTGTDRCILYINGTAFTAITNVYASTVFPSTDSDTAAVGAQGATGGNPLAGLLADVRVYDRTLAPAEIVTIYYSAGADSIYYGLQHRWQLNELSPGTTVPASSVQDSAIQGRTLTTNGSPTYAAHPVRTRKPYL